MAVGGGGGGEGGLESWSHKCGGGPSLGQKAVNVDGGDATIHHGVDDVVLASREKNKIG